LFCYGAAMLDITSPTAAAAGRAALGADPDALATILDPGHDLAVWTRAPDPDLEAALDALLPAIEREARTATPAADATAAAVELLSRCGAPPGPARERLAADAGAQATRLAALTGAETLSMRFATAGSCPLFHVDSVGLRLLCTYRGAGTEWVADDAVQRRQLGLRGRRPARANAAIVPDPHAIQRLAAGWVAILKGRAWPGNTQHGQVHRSPATTRAPRLLLVVDAEA
jgi:hypothetical protein